MDILQLKYFTVLARHLNYVAAADSLGISQSTLSRQISALETELGTPLFTRNPIGLALTPAGEICYGHALYIMSLEEKLRSVSTKQIFEEKNDITLTTMLSNDQTLSECVSLFVKRFPNVGVNIQNFAGQGLVIHLDSEEADFSFALECVARKGPEYISRKIFTDTFCFVVNREQAVLVQEQDFSKLYSFPFLAISRTYSPYILECILKICNAINYVPHFRNMYNHVYGVLMAVNCGVGITILPHSLVDPRFENLVAFPIKHEAALMPFVVTYNKNRMHTTAEKFLAVIDELFPDNK